MNFAEIVNEVILNLHENKVLTKGKEVSIIVPIKKDDSYSLKGVNLKNAVAYVINSSNLHVESGKSVYTVPENMKMVRVSGIF